MKVERSQFGYHLVLEAGEDIDASFRRFARDVRPPSCHIMGIGSVQDLVLGHYDSILDEMKVKRFADSMELSSFVGNLTWMNDEPMLHAHAVAADSEFRVSAGHFLGGVVTVTGEFAVILDQVRIVREKPEGKAYGLIVEFL